MGSELVRIIPSTLWVIFAAVTVWYLREPLRMAMGNLRRVKLPGGFEAQFGESLERASSKKDQRLTDRERSQIFRRFERNAAVLNGARLLWVDDNPAGNANEQRALNAAGVLIDLAQSTQEGVERFRRDRFDVIITDMMRVENDHANKRAGEELLQEIRQLSEWVPVIFYVGREREQPAGALGLTVRPVEVLNLVLDGLERVRG